MPRYGMMIDVSKCTGCYSCFLACKDEYCGNDYPGYSSSQPSKGQYWMRLVMKERGSCPKVKLAYIPTPCMQCGEASCVDSASNGEVFRRPDGVVIIDPEKAKGKRDIVSSCPYRVIYWNEAKGIPQKCTFCAHLLDEGWKEPRCVETCPTEALVFGDLDDPESEISKLISSQDAEVLHPEYGLNPGVYYVGLPKRFVVGEVVLGDDPDECAEGVKVSLISENSKKQIKTDPFGDFEFEGLEPNKEVDIKIEHGGYTPKEFNLKLRKDVNLGEVNLEKA